MKEQKKRVIKEQVSSVVDLKSGEIVEERKLQTLKLPKEPDFVKLYFNDIVLLSGLPKSMTEIVMALVKYINFRNEISLNATIRKRIVEELGIIPNTLTHALKKLCDANILKKEGSNFYSANPYLFARGEWADIYNLRLVCDYTPNGKVIKGYKNYQNEEFDVDTKENTTLSGIDIDIDEAKEYAQKIAETLLQFTQQQKKGLQFLD